ncbi:MAG: SRPBCC family protein [Anaerolineaceae bacterium]|mgnify:FL=1|jgi:uncharacterized protein YndB with AHSA1/START domain|nr:SRPBCC family protein [Anaerolineaceae bacterium]MDD4043706.1 SRPBCC family protein [Anaerolineaceae bacterium]MDD4577696.1 SRPBCC family protein [Anaerolineaceae bacterium]
MAKFEREVEIDASVDNTWVVLTDATLWSKWLPFMDSVSHFGPVSEGTTVRWTAGDKSGTATVTIFNPGKEFEFVTDLDGDKDRHNFTLRSSGGFFGLSDDEVKVEYKLDTLSGGGIFGRFISGGNPRDLIRVKNTTNALRKLVEEQFPK